jgi:hypothetical protein
MVLIVNDNTRFGGSHLNLSLHTHTELRRQSRFRFSLPLSQKGTSFFFHFACPPEIFNRSAAVNFGRFFVRFAAVAFSLRKAAHLALVAAEILARASLDIRRRFRTGASSTAAVVERPPSNARISNNFSLIFSRSASYPTRAMRKISWSAGLGIPDIIANHSPESTAKHLKLIQLG